MSKEQNMQAFQVLEPEKKTETKSTHEQKAGYFDTRLIVFCITNFVINVGISQIAPFYPQMAAQKAGLNYSQIGIVFGINPLGSIVGSIATGRMISVWGRKRGMIVALVLQSSVQTLFGCLNFMTGNKGFFFFMSCFTRILQGFSRSIYSTVTFAYIPIFWPSEFQKKLAIMETMTALGLLFGPMIGSVLNSVFGYSIPFFIIAIFFLLSEIPIYTLMPSDSSIQISSEQKRKLPIFQAFKSVKVCICLLNITIVISGYVFFNPFFINHMASFGINQNLAAFIITIPSVFYMVMLQVVPRSQKYVKKTFLMSLALLVCFSGNMIEAPIWGIGDSIAPVCIGLGLVGIAQACSLLPSIPQLIEFITPVLNDPTLKSGVSDISSALFIMTMGMGSLIGPLMGGSIYDSFGGNVDPTIDPDTEKRAFQHSLEILGMMQFVVGILFFFFADGYKGWQDLFRRCATSEKDTQSREPLIKPQKQEENEPSDGIISDNDSAPDTEITKSTDNFQKQMSEQEMLQGPTTQKVKITREKTPQ